MKKLILLVLVLFLVSQVTYGAAQWVYGTTKIYSYPYSTVKVGIGTSSPQEKLHINGSVRGDQNGALRINTGNGYIDIGPKNSDFAHLSTDRNIFLFNHEIRVDGGKIGSYNENLQLRTSGATRMTISNSNGNVGIGTNSPNSKLSVGGSGDSEYAIYGISGLNGIYGQGQYRGVNGYSNGATGYGVYGYAPVSTGIKGEGVYGVVGQGMAYDFYAASSSGKSYFAGSIGIGTADLGDYKLAVNGHIRAKAIQVETGWSDFVFADNYQLMPLDKLEKHIKKEKSLPGIPKEKEVEENGVNLGKMQAKLLEKVEELTLYVIELKKENEMLRQANESLEYRISALEK